MATETQTTPSTSATTAAPQITVLTRVASIPLISDSLAAVHSTLANNSYTKTPYSAAQVIGSKAYQVSEPIQARLAPVIVRADGFANKAVDVVESRYPYPFHTPTEEIYGTLRQHSEHAYGVANRTIDDRVRTPAYGLVQGIDQTFTPVVDRFEVVVNKLNGRTAAETDAPGPDAPAVQASKDKFQYQRAYRLSMDLKDHLYVYTGEQVKQIQEHNILVQRAATTAHSISGALSSSYDAASVRVHALSDTMLKELQTLQASAAALPANAQASLSGLSERIAAVIAQITDVLRADAPLGEHLARLRVAVEGEVQPLLEGASATVQGAVKAVRGKAEKSQTQNGESLTNGNGSVH